MHIEVVGQCLDEGMTVSKDTITSIKTRIAQIDELLSQQLNEIMHHADFQAVEASWRGLLYLVKNAETGSQLKLRLMNVTKQEIANDVAKAMAFHRTTLFQRSYEN